MMAIPFNLNKKMYYAKLHFIDYDLTKFLRPIRQIEICWEENLKDEDWTNVISEEFEKAKSIIVKYTDVLVSDVYYIDAIGKGRRRGDIKRLQKCIDLLRVEELEWFY